VSDRLVIEGCAIATVDAAGTEYADGHLVIEGDRIVAVGEGAAPDGDGQRIDARGCLATPGLIVASHDLLARNASPSDAEIREALAGNLCRCTGYEKILDAVRLAAVRLA